MTVNLKRMNTGPRVVGAALLLLGMLTAGPVRSDGFLQTITFRVVKSETKHRDRDIQKLYIMLDAEGGRNPVYRAREMMANPDRSVFTYSVDLEEGNYFYTFVPDLDQIYDDLSSVNNNPDEVPEDDYFRDPHPRAAGTCGPFSTDSCLQVVNPDRPRFLPGTFLPAASQIITSGNVELSVDVVLGDNPTPLDPATARMEVELDEPEGVFYHAQGHQLGWQSSGGTFESTGGTGGRISSTWAEPMEGLHRVRLSIKDEEGLDSAPFETYVFVNRQNQPPVAAAGPMRFGVVNQEIVIDGSGSYDPDFIGIISYDWRVVSGPAGSSFRHVNEEGGEADTQCSSAGVVPLATSLAPRFKATQAGPYVLGLTVRDSQGAASPESRVEVQIGSGYSGAVHPRLVVDQEADRLILDASLSTGSSSATFIEDPTNPEALGLDVAGLVASAPVPGDGVYLVHVLVGSGFPRTALIQVENGRAIGVDLAKPPADFWEQEAVIYLAYVREFFDSDGDGEGDFAGMEQRIDHLVDLGVNALWLMPPLPGPTPHGYGMTAHFSTVP